MSLCPFHYQEHRSSDADLIGRFIDAFPLALITSSVAGKHHSSYIPLLRDHDQSLFGHADRRNPQFAGETFNAQIFFVGPNAYIPPEGYSSAQLPTWNYLAVHMQAQVQMVEDDRYALDILRRTAQAMGAQGSRYRVDEADPRVQNNLAHIVGLRLVPSEVEARFKLSQNKAQKDRDAALDWFLSGDLEQHRQLFEDLLRHTSGARE
ncbi:MULTISPECIES: FMN-binding negative transcriptional regulator [Pseudomonas]|uniref:FMN-binding negative transcriptional regulator n=1 Tax=Pseudomonas eucalypticola TaxID=2599595 RepID=A0A7D5D5K1_9PSED|nr:MULTISPECIES: FMN-binding negative transcriptional regulator [Pseudomonas]QKZ03316.1 FMN-binding negative transcriptional regulator [Pseudomonas eucalypticola]WAH57721.1 FMN-binding negative transcriptional regulator [Pseudomonas silvicola]